MTRHAFDIGCRPRLKGVRCLVFAALGIAFSGGASWAKSTAASGISEWPTMTDPSVIAWVRKGAAEAMLVDGAVLLVCVLAGGLLAIGVEALCVWHEQRAEAAAQLRARITTALRGHRLVKDVPLKPIVRLPLWGRATIELYGRVPSVWIRKAVLHLTEREAARSRTPCTIRDRLTVAPSMDRLAA
jgi:hypothetical protein